MRLMSRASGPTEMALVELLLSLGAEVNVRVTIFRALRKLRERMQNVSDSLA